ncbi:MAG: carboxypeptidase regulatory-like domain-containing protein [bacterium]|nr:carboxypeptidase regulatory-like domain-containing protein [bacterium]
MAYTVRVPRETRVDEVPYAPTVVPGVVPDGRLLDLELLRADGWIAGLVIDGDERPLAHACVSIDHGDERRIDGVLAGADGRFRIRTPSSGARDLRVWRTRELEPGEGEVTVLEWELQRRLLGGAEPLAVARGIRAGEAGVTIRLPR